MAPTPWHPSRMTPHRLIATDIVHAIPLALVAGLGYLFAGLVDGQMLLSLLARKRGEGETHASDMR